MFFDSGSADIVHILAFCSSLVWVYCIRYCHGHPKRKTLTWLASRLHGPAKLNILNLSDQRSFTSIQRTKIVVETQFSAATTWRFSAQRMARFISLQGNSYYSFNCVAIVFLVMISGQFKWFCGFCICVHVFTWNRVRVATKKVNKTTWALRKAPYICI